MFPSGLSKINVNTKFFFKKFIKTPVGQRQWNGALKNTGAESISSVCRRTFEVADEIDPAELSDDAEGGEKEEVNDEGDPEEEDKLSKSALKRARKESLLRFFCAFANGWQMSGIAAEYTRR